MVGSLGLDAASRRRFATVLNRKEVDPSWEKKDYAIGMASQVISKGHRLHLS